MDIQLAELKPCYLLEQPEYPKLPQCENASVGSISREVDLSWLAGIIDGEGNIDYSTKVRTTTGGNQFTYFTPKLRITNTDLRMIRKISEIYVLHNIVFFYALNSVKRYKNRKDTWRNQLEITVASQGSMKKMLQWVLPYLVNKRDMASMMIETISFIQAQPHRGGPGQAKVNYCDTPEFKAYMERMKAERQWHVDPSTSIRRARQLLTW